MPNVQIPEMPRIGRVEAVELQVYWDKFFTSEDYRRSLKRRILHGHAAHMEVLLHHMTYGKPKETLALQAAGDGIFVLAIDGQEVRRQVLADGQVIDPEAPPRPALAPPPEPAPEPLTPMGRVAEARARAKAAAAARGRTIQFKTDRPRAPKPTPPPPRPPDAGR